MAEQLVIRMKRPLTKPISEPVWPAGIRLVPFDPDRHVERVHALLVAAYAQGGGFMAPFEVWWPYVKNNPEYDPALCFIAETEPGEVVGLALCWTDAFLKDLAVASAVRGQGLGSALLCHVFQVFRERGAPFIELKVHADNPSGAVRLYRSHGFEDVETFKLAIPA
ncbi:ribosomal protein S18 acetylase RimI-like enzyme [Microvirga lupini]|uniref:Ribosomal protein S18 acetylase RimI-like enzyme n=1 Tax=Microvirga lupini TaxID=420324 RepID=A0A7W4YZL4_9HYPH|nr:N-acetyltransferase [Microvirga lupini]MBB3021158.1 ribosomal protein S18 acetylase RimI-like enzyme [Microvirga lupini]